MNQFLFLNVILILGIFAYSKAQSQEYTNSRYYNGPVNQHQQYPQQYHPSLLPVRISTYQIQQQQQLQQKSPNSNQQYQQQQIQKLIISKPTVNSRFSEMMGDEPSNNNFYEDLSTRQPSKSSPKPTRTTSPPPVFDSRFHNSYNSRKLTYDKELAQKNEIFALKLFTFVTNDEESNFMISPYSIRSLLELIAEGAAGNTYQELNETLGLISQAKTRDFHQYTNLALDKSDADITLRKFSAMIGDVNRPIDREYEDIVEKIYDAEYIPVNFQDIDQTLREVNGKVSQNTNGQIRDAVSKDDLLKAQLILLSGLHFKGSWKSVFNTTFTKAEPFFDSNHQNNLGTVNMMFQRGSFAYAAVQDFGCYLLELPYGTNSNPGASRNDAGVEDRISMILVLPKKGLSLVNAIGNIYSFGIERVLMELKTAKDEFEDEEVEVHIPRFEVETSLNLVEILKEMGIKDMFEAQLANLSRINKNYYVSSILHKTKIRVDEKGTEASAVSTSIFANKATPPKFQANRPFFYFIVDKATKLILFEGVYRQPKFV